MNRLFLAAMTMAILVWAGFAQAEEVVSNSAYTHDLDALQTQGFGVHFGNVSGNGYAWRYMAENYGFQLVLGGYTSGDNKYRFNETQTYGGSVYPSTLSRTEDGRKYYLNMGANFILPLKRTEYTLFYLHAGANWNYSDLKKYNQRYIFDHTTGSTNYYDKYGSPDISHKINSYVNIGAGPGFELALGKYVKLALELPVTYTGKDEFLMYIPQAGLYYYFK